MRIERVRCPQDRRPKGAGISHEVRMFVRTMAAAGFRLTLSDDGRRVQVGGRRSKLTDDQLLVLRGRFAEIRQLLTDERERPQ